MATSPGNEYNTGAVVAAPHPHAFEHRLKPITIPKRTYHKPALTRLGVLRSVTGSSPSGDGTYLDLPG